MKRKSILFFPAKNIAYRKTCWLFLFFLVIASLASVSAQVKTISGRITDDQGKGLEGANMKVQGTNNGTTSDATGHYSINVPANAVLVISFSGFKEKSIPVKGQQVINTSLVRDISNLEEVIVTGYRTQTRGSVNGSVTSVKGSAVVDVPVDNISNALAGRLSGVTITQGSGTPGMQSDIRIQGLGYL